MANEAGLRALGERIDRAAGPVGPPAAPPVPRRPTPSTPARRRRRWSRRRKILTALTGIVVLALLVVAAGYGYLRYEWSQVRTLACPSCVSVANGQPFNVLLIGSDSRAGDTGQASQSFGSASQVTGQRSDTIKIVHVDPETGSADILSIPRDTYVTMSGLPESSGLTGVQKINTAFDNGPDPLIKTIENTFGIPISHFIVVNFTGVINTVDTLGGIRLDFPYLAKDDDNGNNNSGLSITKTGCQTLNGAMTLALSRSRYYTYYDPAQGGWITDGSADLGRITRQNAIIEAIIRRVHSTYNPFTLRAFLSSIVHNITVDQNMTFGDMYGLAERYHAFSPSSLKTYLLPTTPAVTSGGADVEVVSEPAAQQTLEAFLGTSPNPPTTPPVDAYGNPVEVPPPTSAAPASAPAPSGSAASTAPAAAPTTPLPSYDPTPC